MTDEHRSHGALVTPNEYYAREFLERQRRERAKSWAWYYNPEVLVVLPTAIPWSREYRP